MVAKGCTSLDRRVDHIYRCDGHSMDDWNMIVGIMTFSNVLLLFRLMTADPNKPYFVQGFKELSQSERILVENILAMQLDKGWKKGHPAYLGAIHATKLL